MVTKSGGLLPMVTKSGGLLPMVTKSGGLLPMVQEGTVEAGIDESQVFLVFEITDTKFHISFDVNVAEIALDYFRDIPAKSSLELVVTGASSRLCFSVVIH